jgi:prolyl-tRNA editing enzyme YbaK/EbsC (Cys-tRNA(Pro) deacylase)
MTVTDGIGLRWGPIPFSLPNSGTTLGFMTRRPRSVTEIADPAIQRVVSAASRRGVALDVRLLPGRLRTVEETAAVLGADVGQIVKTLVFVAPRPASALAPVVCLTSSRSEIDLRLLAAVTGEVSIRAATAYEASNLTGYGDGDIPSIGHDREVRTVMDQDLSAHQWVWAAAGGEGALFRVAPRTLRALSNAVVAPVTCVPREREFGHGGFAPVRCSPSGARRGHEPGVRTIRRVAARFRPGPPPVRAAGLALGTGRRSLLTSAGH